MLLANLAQYLRQKAAADPSLHVISAAGSADDMPMLQPDTDPQVLRAELVEGSELRSIAVGEAAADSGFTCFLDGIQRGQVVFYRELLPVVYGYTAAVVRARRARRMATRWGEASEKLYLPYVWLDPADLQAAGIETADCSPERTADKDEFHPLMLKRYADQTIAKTRRDLEIRLVKRWLESGDDGCLFLDGTTTLAQDIAQDQRVVGVIKSHQTQYFPLGEQRQILSLKAGERSNLFRPTSRAFTPVYSWYLRLRPCTGHDLYFGLVRVEAPATAETLRRADDICRWLLAEAQPLALPDARWDRMIYPIRDCEEYLRSRAPTRATLEGMLAALNP